uniref:Dynactin subunit 5 n=1 Tax=Proboscia inermis TaxID=420281 RepID=A0A7S0C6H6_9STRA|mmetsp:Transcript_30114/g.30470  ORF Transcript_30114/g.30470 Transcript_30114/m.30470 type:complete len:159 (+) Transcript_30114:92-568(+)
MKGKSVVLAYAILRGDFNSPIRIGRYVSIGIHTILRPPTLIESSGGRSMKPTMSYLPITVGNNTRIGKYCVIEATAVGSSVFIGDDVVLSKRCIIKDCCRIEDGTVVPSDMVIPPFSIVKGCPAKIVGELPESAAVDIVDESVDAYTAFVQEQQQQKR